MLSLSINTLITVAPIFVNVKKIDDRSGFSEPGGVSLPAVASDSVVPSGAVRAMACSSDVNGITSLMMHPTYPCVPSKVLARSGFAS